MDWRENGEQLTHLFQLAAIGSVANLKWDFLQALITLNKDPAALVSYLRSRQDLGPIEQEILAASIERAAQGKKNGRPPDPITQALVWGACLFKDAWVYSNAELPNGHICGQGRVQHDRHGVAGVLLSLPMHRHHDGSCRQR